MNLKKTISHTIRHLQGMFVNGTIGKIYNVINFNGYMKAKTRHMKKLGINVTSPLRYISSDVYFDGDDYSLITIGKDVVISREVMLLTHDYSLGAGMRAMNIKIKEGAKDTPHINKPITIGDHTFIGARASLLPGTVIGEGCIIGACSVVKGNIPDYSIVIGNPAKIIANTKDWVKKMISTHDFGYEVDY